MGQGSPAHGAKVGLFVGNGVVGDSVGTTAGEEVGVPTGLFVGAGLIVGDRVFVGLFVGTELIVGDSVPARGIGVGETVGLMVCTPSLQFA